MTPKGSSVKDVGEEVVKQEVDRRVQGEGGVTNLQKQADILCG